jgi:hypothetical protein
LNYVFTLGKALGSGLYTFFLQAHFGSEFENQVLNVVWGRKILELSAKCC